MPPRAGTSSSRGRSKRGRRPTFVPSTQFPGEPGPSSSVSASASASASRSRSRSFRDESEDPLAFSPIKITPVVPRTQTRTRRSARSSNIRSSPSISTPDINVLPPSTQPHRSTRGSRKKGRELGLELELEWNEGEDLVPPSEDDEYEEWKESRRIRMLKSKGKQKNNGTEDDEEQEKDDGQESYQRKQLGDETSKGMRRPRKPDKNLEMQREYESLLPSPPPPSSPSPSIASSVTDTRSRDTSPTQPLSFSQQDDPFFTVYQGEQHLLVKDNSSTEYVDALDLLRRKDASPENPVSKKAVKAFSEIESKSIELPNSPRSAVAKEHLQADTNGFRSPDQHDLNQNDHGIVMNHNNHPSGSKSRSTTPQTLPMIPSKEDNFETLLPTVDLSNDVEPIAISQNYFVSKSNDPHLANLIPDRYRSPTPQTLPYIPAQDEAFETMLPRIQVNDKVEEPEYLESPAPETIPFLPDQDQAYETMLPGSELSGNESVFPAISQPSNPPLTLGRQATSQRSLPAPSKSPELPIISHTDDQPTLSAIPNPSPAGSFPNEINDITITQPIPIDEVLLSPSKPTPYKNSSPAESLSPIFAAVAEPPIIAPSPALPQFPTPSPADPALERFRGARTFRTRTVLQLQPYTKERQIYEAALRKGGLKKGKKAIAPSREITQEEVENEEDEARVSESSEASAEEDSPERIVIGNTPPATKPRESKKLIDADFDEFFFEHGTAADENDPDHVKDLQDIARRRLQAVKEEKRRKKEATKERKQFESLMQRMRGAEESSAESEEEPGRIEQVSQGYSVNVPCSLTLLGKQPVPPRTVKPRPTARTPGGTKTYGGKRKSPKRPIRPLSESDNDSTPPARIVPPISPRTIQINNTPTASFRTAVSALDDVDMDIGYGQPQEPFYPDNNANGSPSPAIRHEGSFFINDIPRLPHPSPPADADGESDSGSSRTSDAQDRRQKIARRMMPAAMLRRLEAEAAEKEKRKAEKKRQEQRIAISPIRPGRAVTKRGGGHGGVDDMGGLFDSDGDDDDDIELVPETTPSVPPHASIPKSFDEPIVIPDGNSSSEAEEDNQAEQTLARLHRGDFESIVTGNRWKINETKRKDNHSRLHKSRSNQSHRPALGLVKRVKAPIQDNNRAMIQKRLDFPAKDKSSVSPIKKKRKRPLPQGNSRQQRRPAIRLDDHVIFATADFEFDNESAEEEQPQPRSATKKKKFQSSIPRHFARTPSSNLDYNHNHVQTKSFDSDLGKARSWANFDKFPIDFDITPLPSGLYCDFNSVPGSGKLKRLLNNLNGTGNDDTIEPCFDHGIELRQDMIPGSIQAVVPLLFDAVYRQIVVIANEDEAEDLHLDGLDFLGMYILKHRNDIDENVITLKSETENAIRQLNLKLDEIDIGRNKQGRESILAVRWALLELSCRLEANDKISKDPESSLVKGCAIKLFGQLLAYGFDKTIRPLKQIMRGESDSAEIKDITVTLWISLIHALFTWDQRESHASDNTFLSCLNQAFDSIFHLDQTGPIAAERIWFLVFGLCALSQFDVDGSINTIFITSPRWMLVRRAVGLIKVAFDEDAEKKAHLDQLQGRDRYIKVMMARCVRLSAVWKWSFDRESFTVATRDLGIIFKDRQYRNLPTEPPVDYPDFITRFDMSLTAAEDTKRETAFELYLRLVCVAASDIISSAQTLVEAQQAERDVQRLVMSIIPISSVKFNRLFPPSPKDLGRLINRYSTMIAGCYFSPSLLTYLLANSKKWSLFEESDFDSRQIVIRGLMYLTIARRHHNQPLQPVVNRLSELMSILQTELDNLIGPSNNQSNQTPNNGPTRLEIERTMVLIVSCFKQMIKHHSFDLREQEKPVYPDSCLLNESWTIRIFDLDLSKDLKCGLEVISTIQTFLDTRATILPRLAKQRREAKESHSESFDEFGSLGIDFTDADVLALGGELGQEESEVEKQDQEFAKIIANVISPKIYRLLSDMLPPGPEDNTATKENQADRQIFISKLTKCWSDCAAVLVVEHQRSEWSVFISSFGRQSWSRLGDERGRVQVGLHFMLNVAQLDPGAFAHHEEDFVALLFQVIGTDKLTVEHKYLSALLAMPGTSDHLLLAPLGTIEAFDRELSRDGFMGIRTEALKAIFTDLPELLKSSKTPASIKSFIYRCINLFVSSLISYDKSINPSKIIHKESYRAFTDTIIRDLKRIAGDYITPLSVPGLKYFQ
ncbi:uncharacterized protein L201_003552 [Kwoniella dendrophila CBS 6074]|uniref:Mus7/MMS22 family-domain-containing protein n=1 Tax=Kwoniella dendrophila CBS 6074 TaxID=1295534 RepID=A0AAX4JUR4_9TREE